MWLVEQRLLLLLLLVALVGLVDTQVLQSADPPLGLSWLLRLWLGCR